MLLVHLTLLVSSTSATRVAVLSGHEPTAWEGPCSDLPACNLKVYEAAARAASLHGATMILFPEAYGLSKIDASFEPFVSTAGALPCGSAATSPQQQALACMARRENSARTARRVPRCEESAPAWVMGAP